MIQIQDIFRGKGVREWEKNPSDYFVFSGSLLQAKILKKWNIPGSYYLSVPKELSS